MKIKLFSSIIICAIILIMLAGCGSSEQVPDSAIQEAVKSCQYYDSTASINWTATHNVDKELHTDTVIITMAVEYKYGALTTEGQINFQYDRASDLWYVCSLEEWSDPTYTFNDKLIGDWHIDYFDNSYDISVESVKNDKITLDCYVDEGVYGGLYTGDVRCKMAGGGTFHLNNSRYISVPLNLPDGFFVSWKDTKSGLNETTTYLNLVLNPEDGIRSAYITPSVYVYGN